MSEWGGSGGDPSENKILTNLWVKIGSMSQKLDDQYNIILGRYINKTERKGHYTINSNMLSGDV